VYTNHLACHFEEHFDKLSINSATTLAPARFAKQIEVQVRISDFAQYPEPARIGKRYFTGWIDAGHYLYFSDNTLIVGEIGVEMTIVLNNIPPALFPDNLDSFIIDITV